MYTLPQEIEVWYVIPAIRRDLAKCLINNHKVTYERVGDILGISKAAVSQYIGKKRATKIKLHDEVSNEICESCELIVEKKSDAVKEITRILEYIRKKKLPSEVCGDINDGVLDDCKEVVIHRQT